MKYFYARVSSKGQNLARQYEAAKSVDGISETFSDKQSGKSFDRPEYQRLKSVVTSGDEVIIKSLDRLGRNKDEMKQELDWFRRQGVIVRVMDLPTTMIEMPTGQEWVLDMVNNILIEVLGAIAEQERLTIRQRQQEGIAAMPVVNGKKISAKTGRGFGRIAKEVDMTLFQKLFFQKKRGYVTVEECCERLGIGRSKWYELEKERAATLGKKEVAAQTKTNARCADTTIVSQLAD